MDNLLAKTKELCKIYGINPARSKGQNFLINDKIYDRIIEAADLKPEDIVLEVGPGLGFLTAMLAKNVKRVIAVELDDKLAGLLDTALKSQKVNNVEVVNEDILKFSIFNFQFSNNFEIQNSKFKIVANLPYNITSFFLRKFLSEEIKPEYMVLMLQKEVAERIVARAGKMSLLSVSVQFYSKPEIVEIVKAENFWPKPEVDSAIIKLEVRTLPIGRQGTKYEIDEKSFFRLVKMGFSAKRKKLANNLAGGLRIGQIEVKNLIKSAGIPENARAQELSLDDWVELFGIYSKNVV